VTQAELARICGVTENTLCNKMQGRTEFKTDEIMKICEALDIQDAATRGEIFLT
jgi:transcriptional regulator with XRE-family HTH domain